VKISCLPSNGLSNKLLSLLLFAAACALFAWAHAVLVPSSWHIALLAYGGSLALLVIREFLPRQKIQEKKQRVIEILALIAVLITASFFRMSYVYSVPLGFQNEVFSQHLSFADVLVTKDFVYLPMWQWSSTLHSYIIALIWKIFGESLSSFRLYLAFVAIVSCGVMFWWMRRLFGIREALLGGILLATSPFHQYFIRGGSHIVYLPLFAMLLFGVLFVMTKSNRKISLAVLASIVIVLGMHAYWVFCLEIAAIPFFILYCVITERGFLRKNWRALTLLVLLSTVMLIPLANFFYHYTQRHSYITGQFAKSDNQTRIQKYIDNLKKCYYTYSASPDARKYTDKTPVAYKAFLIAGGIGFFLCLVRFRKSRAHALLVILFIAHLAGLTVTKAIYYYAFQLLLFWIAFAAVAIGEAWKLLDGCVQFQGLKLGIFSLFVVFLAISSWVDYHYYFYNYMIVTPRMNQLSANASALYCIEDMRASMGKFDLYLPRNEYEKDLGFSIFFTSGCITEYKPINSTKTIMTNSIFFPGAPSKKGRSIMAYLPSIDFWTEVAIPRLKALYPNMQVMKILAPAPWPPDDKQALLKLVIPYEDLISRKGMKAEMSDADGWSAQGYFMAEKPGYYSFDCGEGCDMEVGEIAADGPMLLAEGVVPLKLWCNSPPEYGLRISFKNEGDKSMEISGNLFNAPSSADALIAPCLTRAAAPASFAFAEKSRYDLSKAGMGPVTNAILMNGKIYCVKADGTFMTLNTDLSDKKSFTLGSKGQYRFVISPSGQLWVYRMGGDTIYIVDNNKGPIPTRLEGKQDIQGLDFSWDGFLYALSKGKLLIYAHDKLSKPFREVALSPVPPEKLPLKPYSMAVGSHGEVAILDGGRQELIIFGDDGKVIGRVTIPHLWADSYVKDDLDGNWNILIVRKGSAQDSFYCMYNSSRRPIINPKNKWFIFPLGEGKILPSDSMGKFHILSNGDLVFLINEGDVHYMRRVPSSGVGGSEEEKGSKPK